MSVQDDPLNLPRRWSNLERERVQQQIDLCPLRRARASEIIAALTLGEIAQGDIGFGDDEIIIDQRRDQSERVKLTVFSGRLVQYDLVPLRREIELGKQKKRTLCAFVEP